MNMTTPTFQYTPSSSMALYEPLRQISTWEDEFQGDIVPGTGVCQIPEAETKLDNKDDNRASKSFLEKTQRRLAQNRKAARKSRLRKKAYVQQLETSRVKLAKIEHELERTRQHGLFIASTTDTMGLCGTLNSGIAAFLMEYGHWIDEQERKMSELRNVMQFSIGDRELQIMVQNVLKHYCNLFRIKKDGARADAFYLVSGTWKTPVERLFLWIGGFQPSALINVVMTQLVPLSEQQKASVNNLKHSCMQAEDALSQGMEKLQQTLGQSLTVLAMGPGSYSIQMPLAIDKLESLQGFILQADNLQEQTLQHMLRILTTRQAAMGLLAFGEYFQRMRALSSLWTARPQTQELGLM